MWLLQHQHAVKQAEDNPDLDFNDIIEIEGVGPLLILANWGHVLRRSLWIHYIDNSSALGSLVKGSSTVTQQDVIVGQTWEYISELDVLPWFDRVDSTSNPVDGLSRQDFTKSENCDWLWKGIDFPKQLRGAIRESVRHMKASLNR